MRETSIALRSTGGTESMDTHPSPPTVAVCEMYCSDEAKVARVKSTVQHADGLGTLFKALGDETRAKIMYCLSQDELCVCDVANIMGMSIQAVSHHLRLLLAARLVRYRREGKQAFYSLDDEHILGLIHQGLSHVQHTAGREEAESWTTRGE